VILVDANVLLYAYDPRSRHHEPCRDWLEGAFSGSGPVGLSWMTIVAFVRISTNRRVYEQPLSIGEAVSIVNSWLELPSTLVLDPGEQFWGVFQRVLLDGQVVGPLVSDAALVAVALEHGATVCTTDRDFDRFSGLALLNPLTS